MAEPIIKKRKIGVIHDEIDESQIKDEFGKEQGIISVSIEREKGQIIVEYDLWKINFEKIERMLEDMGLVLSKKIKEKLKRGMAKFTEQNELDNLKITPSSCCDDPRESAHKAHR